jgi:hypothetical protein
VFFKQTIFHLTILPVLFYTTGMGMFSAGTHALPNDKQYVPFEEPIKVCRVVPL